MKKKLFISYSHEDIVVVKQFALQLSLRGFDLWMDEKNIRAGSNYTTAILQGIHEADFYLIFLSEHSLRSPWVNAEIDFAMREKIEKNRLSIIPIRLDDSEIPVALSNLDYIDARGSAICAADELAYSCNAARDLSEKPTGISINSVAFEISENTVVEVGPFNEGITTKDLEENKNQILKELRKKAYGILMNFVSAEDFDFQSTLPKFKNGMYEEETQKIAGSTSGSICENIRVEAIVFHPDERKVKRLLNERLSVLNINAITFGFVVPVAENESLMTIGKRCLRKIQEEYIILSYDNSEGAKVEIADDFYLSFMVSEHVIKIRLSTKYEFQFEKRMKDFSVIDFLEKLLVDEQEWIKEDKNGADAPGQE